MHYVPDYLMADWKKAYAENNFEILLERVKEEYNLHPEEKDFLVSIHAMCTRLLKRPDETIALCTKEAPGITNEKAYMDTMQQLAFTYDELGRDEEQLQVYKQLHERFPHHFWTEEVAKLCEKLGYTEEAMAYYELDAEGSDDEELFEKIVAYYEGKKDYNKAYEYLEKVARLINGDPPFYWCEAGRMKAMAGEKEEAMFLFKMVTKLNPEMASPFYFMGNVFQEAGDIYRAMDNYYKALALDPNYAEVYNNLGVIQYNEEGNIKGAIAFMEKALETDVKGKTKQTLYLNLTRLYKQIADYDKQEYYNQLFVETVFPIDEFEDDEEDEEDWDEDEDDFDEDDEEE